MLPHYRLWTAECSFHLRVEAQDEVALAFGIPDRLIDKVSKLEDRLPPGQVPAKLESHNELHPLRQAQARLAAAGPFQSQNGDVTYDWIEPAVTGVFVSTRMGRACLA
jgi:hypothetical protein